MARQLDLIDDDLGHALPEPAFLTALDWEILMGLGLLLERHARFEDYLAEQPPS